MYLLYLHKAAMKDIFYILCRHATKYFHNPTEKYLHIKEMRLTRKLVNISDAEQVSRNVLSGMNFCKAV